MSKILFTADIHIKLNQKSVPKDVGYNRFQQLFSAIYELEKQVDLHIIGGDLFDSMPKMDEFALFIEFITGVSIPTIIYAGNHEATKKGYSFLSSLKNIVSRINPLVEIVDSIREYDTYTIVPYEFIKDKKTWESVNPDKAIFTHVRGYIPPHVEPEIDLTQLEKFPVVWAGDLHGHSNSQGNIVYPGSPMTTSFHRTLSKDNGYIIINSEDLSWKWHRFNLPQLLRKRVTDLEEAVADPFHWVVYELEGDDDSLVKASENKLVERKISNKVSDNPDAAMIFTDSMTILDMLEDYLLYIKGMKEDRVKRVIGVFNEYIGEI